ncbi:MAG: 50S ribosomal protein L11 methyltransferase [Wenzhouxiangellaceae bacterium]|nr:50S ribosomal protein L11 methyltransferase [Wenzhouxiangellaceae bacterium]
MPRTLRLQPAAGRLDATEALLWKHGALAITLLDAADQPLLEPGPGEIPIWDEVTLEALLPDTADPVEIVLALTAAGLVDSPAETRLIEVPERDWERAWMDRFEPMRFGESIWICPSHVEPDPAWPIVVRLDPGLAFGTGTHPTTALCLEWLDGEWLDGEWLDGQDLQGRQVIDYGCGSGVLAVAAALKGAARVVAIDHDPQALAATRENAVRNGVGDRIETALPDETEPAPADVVLANILAGVLVELAPRLASLVAPGGRLVLSGILEEQAGSVVAAYRERLTMESQAGMEGWVRLEFRHTARNRRPRPAESSA